MSASQEFFLRGSGADTVLLIHGLAGTPREMRILGKGLHAAGYTVLGVQLPGHCGSAEDLVATRWDDWYQRVEQAAEGLLAYGGRLFVGGLSMGALLALTLAARRPEWVSGVGVYGATFRYDGWSIGPIGKIGFMLPWFKRLGIWQNRTFMESPPYGLRDLQLRARVSAAMLGGDSAAAGLAGNPWPALAEMYKLSTWIRRNLHRVVAPCLVIHAREDDVASLANAKLVLRKVSAPTDFVILEDSYHMITIDCERRKVIQRSLNFLDRLPTPVLTPSVA